MVAVATVVTAVAFCTTVVIVYHDDYLFREITIVP
jgi:hypothetical protein